MGERSGIMLAYPFEEKRLAKWDFPKVPVIVQPKLDGERCRATLCEHGPILLSSEGNYIHSVPHIKEEVGRLFAELCESHRWYQLDGELYRLGMGIEQIRSIVGRTKNIHPNYTDMEYHIFDTVSSAPQELRLGHLARVQSYICDLGLSKVRIIPHQYISSFDDLMALCEIYIQQGYEGMIIRKADAPYIPRRVTTMMKWKPSHTKTYPIIGYVQEVSKDGLPKTMVGSVLCEDLDSGERFKVSCSKLTHAVKANLWEHREELASYEVVVEYQNLTKRGVPRFGRVAEIKE